MSPAGWRRHGDAVEPVARGDVEDPQAAAGLYPEVAGQQRTQEGPTGYHRAGEFDPDWMLRRERAVPWQRRAAATDGRRQLGERLEVGLPSDGDHQRTDVRRRTPIEERRCVSAEAVAIALLPEKADDCQIIAEDADATLCGVAPHGEAVSGRRSFADRREEI